MSKKYEFTQTEQNGTEYVIGQPTSGAGEPVRLSADWTKGDEIEGQWERAVRTIIKTDLMGSMELKEGNGHLSRRRAVEVLAGASDEQGRLVTSETQADALIDYFAEQNILTLEGNDVVLLRNPKDEDIPPEMMINWAAGIDACVEKISETISTIESAQEKLENQLEELDASAGSIDQRRQETAQKLKTLGDSPGVPQDPSALSESDQQQYEQLKRELLYHEQMQKVDKTNLVEQVRKGKNELANNIAMLKSAQDALSSKREEVRVMALNENIFPEDAISIVDNMADLATQLAGIENIDQTVENTSPTELADLVGDITGEVSETVETAEETAGEKTDSDLQM